MNNTVAHLQQRVTQLEQRPNGEVGALATLEMQLEEHLEALRADIAQLKREIMAMKARMGLMRQQQQTEERK